MFFWKFAFHELKQQLFGYLCTHFTHWYLFMINEIYAGIVEIIYRYWWNIHQYWWNQILENELAFSEYQYMISSIPEYDFINTSIWFHPYQYMISSIPVNDFINNSKQFLQYWHMILSIPVLDFVITNIWFRQYWYTILECRWWYIFGQDWGRNYKSLN